MQSVFVAEKAVTIGRGEVYDINVIDNRVSRLKHATVERFDEKLFITCHHIVSINDKIYANDGIVRIPDGTVCVLGGPDGFPIEVFGIPTKQVFGRQSNADEPEVNSVVDNTELHHLDDDVNTQPSTSVDECTQRPSFHNCDETEVVVPLNVPLIEHDREDKQRTPTKRKRRVAAQNAAKQLKDDVMTTDGSDKDLDVFAGDSSSSEFVPPPKRRRRKRVCDISSSSSSNEDISESEEEVVRKSKRKKFAKVAAQKIVEGSDSETNYFDVKKYVLRYTNNYNAEIIVAGWHCYGCKKFYATGCSLKSLNIHLNKCIYANKLYEEATEPAPPLVFRRDSHTYPIHQCGECIKYITDNNIQHFRDHDTATALHADAPKRKWFHPALTHSKYLQYNDTEDLRQVRYGHAEFVVVMTRKADDAMVRYGGAGLHNLWWMYLSNQLKSRLQPFQLWRRFGEVDIVEKTVYKLYFVWNSNDVDVYVGITRCDKYKVRALSYKTFGPEGDMKKWFRDMQCDVTIAGYIVVDDKAGEDVTKSLMFDIERETVKFFYLYAGACLHNKYRGSTTMKWLAEAMNEIETKLPSECLIETERSKAKIRMDQFFDGILLSNY